jgi:NAD dependent epimerase/dehydratase family
VLIVGGAGYIGGALTDQLTQLGHLVRVYDFLLYENRYLKPIEFIRGDVRDIDRLRPHLNWADVVVWLAALVGDGACSLDHADIVRARGSLCCFALQLEPVGLPAIGFREVEQPAIEAADVEYPAGRRMLLLYQAEDAFKRRQPLNCLVGFVVA